MIHTQKKKNKFFTFICSLVPGAAEMYMGFLKNGLSLLILCMICILLCGAFSELFLVPLAIVWIYGFFHAWNIAGLDDEDFGACSDVYVWEEFTDGRDISLPEDKIKKIAPVALLFVGFGILWNFVFSIVIKFIPGDYWNIFYPIIKGVPGLVFAVLFIILGFRLLKGKKQQLYIEHEVPVYIESSKNVDAVIEEKADKQSKDKIETKNEEITLENADQDSEDPETVTEQ